MKRHFAAIKLRIFSHGKRVNVRHFPVVLKWIYQSVLSESNVSKPDSCNYTARFLLHWQQSNRCVRDEWNKYIANVGTMITIWWKQTRVGVFSNCHQFRDALWVNSRGRLINLAELCSRRFKREVRSPAFEGKHLKCLASQRFQSYSVQNRHLIW